MRGTSPSLDWGHCLDLLSRRSVQYAEHNVTNTPVRLWFVDLLTGLLNGHRKSLKIEMQWVNEKSRMNTFKAVT